MSQKEILQLGAYTVEREDDLVGIKVFVLHYGTDLVLFDYLGKDHAADRYFFKARKGQKIKSMENRILDQSYDQLNSRTFHPFLLDLEKIFGTKGY